MTIIFGIAGMVQVSYLAFPPLMKGSILTLENFTVALMEALAPLCDPLVDRSTGVYGPEFIVGSALARRR
jgi:hypothetical protein